MHRRSLALRLVPLALALGLVATPPAWAEDGCADATTPCFNGREDVPRERVRFAGCERIQRDPAGSCVTTISGAVAVIGLGSGESCLLDPNPGSDGESLSWRGEAIYVCDGSPFDGVVERGSLSEGDVTRWESLRCSGVTDYAGGILVRAPLEDLLADLSWFSDAEALQGGEPERTFRAAVFNDGPMTTSGSLLFSTWHSANVVDVFDLRSGKVYAPIELERESDWIRGLAILADGRIVLVGGIIGDRLEVFRADGAAVRVIPLGDPQIPGSGGFVSGLACVSGPGREPPRRLATIRRPLR